MEKVTRFSVTITPEQLERFDELIEEKGYANRSEAVRDLIRNAMVEEEWEKDAEVVGSLTLVYNHEVSGVMDRLTEIQHEQGGVILSSMHLHLDAHNCLEVLVLRGRAGEIKHISELLISAKGVKHGELVTTTAGKGIG